MKDQLEDFVMRNRSLFDDDEPAPSVWEQLDKSLPAQTRKVKLSPFAYAASLVIVAVSGYMLSMLMPQEKSASDALSKNLRLPTQKKQIVYQTDTVKMLLNPAQNIADASITKASDPISDIANYYKSEISKRKTGLMTVAHGDPELLSQINEELSMIDTLEAKSRRDLQNNMNAGIVMEEMIRNYKMSLDILDMMIDQMNESYALSKND